MSWYRDYRPTSISGLHLTAVRRQLEQLRAAKSFPHALLLTGPRGAGKTSTARILAAMLNSPERQADKPLPDPDLTQPLIQRIFQGSSLAVQELDAASHRGIDDIRALKEQAYLPPQEGQALVFILDEVHMLTSEAFNALLKILEEPPPQVIFILATTEEQKVPVTIQSRTTVIRFPKATTIELEAALTPILREQALEVDPGALSLILQTADGSFRDAVKLLETAAMAGPQISLATVKQMVRTSDADQVWALLDAVVGKDELQLQAVFAALRQNQVDQKSFLQQLLLLLHQDFSRAVTQSDDAKYPKRISQFLLAQFSDPFLAQPSPIPLLGLELKAFELIFRAQDKQAGGSGGPVTTTKASMTRSEAPVVTRKSAAAVASPVSAVSLPSSDIIPPPAPAVIADPALSMTLIEQWSQFLAVVEKNNSSLAALLRSAKPSLASSGAVTVELFYQFHRDQLRQAKFLVVLEQAAARVCGQAVRFEFQLAQSSQLTQPLASVTAPPGEVEQLVQLAQDVFL